MLKNTPLHAAPTARSGQTQTRRDLRDCFFPCRFACLLMWTRRGAPLAFRTLEKFRSEIWSIAAEFNLSRLDWVGFLRRARVIQTHIFPRQMSALSIFPYKGQTGKVVRQYYHTWHLPENEERLLQKATVPNSNWRHFTPQLPRGRIHGWWRLEKQAWKWVLRTENAGIAHFSKSF